MIAIHPSAWLRRSMGVAMALALGGLAGESLAQPTPPSPPPEGPESVEAPGPTSPPDSPPSDAEGGPRSDEPEGEGDPEPPPPPPPPVEPAPVPPPEVEPVPAPRSAEAEAGAEVEPAERAIITTTQPGDMSSVDDGVENPGDHVPSFLRALRLGEDSLMIGGYIQPGFFYQRDTEFNQDDQDGFDFGNARFTGRGALPIWRKLAMGFKFNFDVNQGNFGVRDVYGSLWWGNGPRGPEDDAIARIRHLGFDAGQLKQPFGLSLLQSQSKLQFAFSPATRILAFGRDIGARVRSDFELGPVWIRILAMVANGEGGFRQRRNLDDEFQYTARLEVAPLGEMEMSQPDLKNSDFQLTLGGNVGYTPSLGKGLGLGDVGAEETRYGADLRMWFRGASLRFEALFGRRQANGAEPAFGRWGVSGQAGYVLPIPIDLPQFELVFRYTQFDVNDAFDGAEGTDYLVDNTEIRFIEPGLAIYLFEHHMKLLMNYRLTDLQEGPEVDTNGDVLIGDAWLTYFQFAYL